MAGAETSISQLRRGILEYCVLALLTDEQRYSYEIVATLGEIDGLVTSEGTLYPLLSRLRRDGLLKSTLRESPSGPARRYYTTTKDGDAVLRAFTLQWAEFRQSVDSLLQGVLA